jgi:hypothetical protein
MSERPAEPPAPEDSGRNASTVRVYGLTLRTDLDFVAPLAPSSEPPTLHVSAAPAPIGIEDAERLYAGRPIERGEAADSGLYRRGEAFLFRFAHLVDFRVTPDRITYHLREAAYDYSVEICLLGTVLAFWLEWQGRPALHAAAVASGTGAIGFMASNRGGKSSLAAACMARGNALLTDDLLVLDAPPNEHREADAPRGRAGQTAARTVRGQPGYPQLRMWPDQAAHFVEDTDALAPVHPYLDKKRVPADAVGTGRFCSAAQPLRALYLPERRDDVETVDIQPITPGEAVIELIRGSFVAPLVAAAGWQRRQLARLTRIAQRVPLRRLVYPSGVTHLPDVVAAVR